MKDDELKLPAALPALAFISGILAAPHLTDGRGTALLLAVIATLTLCVKTKHRSRPALIVLCLALGVGRGWHDGTTKKEIEQRITALDPDRFVTITGTMRQTWREVRPGSVRLRLAAATVRQDHESFPLRETVDIYLGPTPPPIGSFETIEAEGFLRRSANGRLTLSVKSASLVTYSGSLRASDPRNWNRIVTTRLDAAAGERYRNASYLAKALALGQSESLPHELRRSYRDGGTYHLLVFSGLQIALAAAALLLFLRWLRMPRLADWLVLLLAMLAPPFAGAEASVTRASQMIGLYAVSRILHRPTEFANLLFVSAIIRLLQHPAEISDGSFLLTYTATAGIVLTGRAFASFFKRKPLQSTVRGIGAEVMLWPLTLTLFNRIILGSSLLTIVISPVVVLMLVASVTMCIAAAVSPVAFHYAASSLELLDVLCRWSNDLVGESPLSRMTPAPPVWLTAASYAAFFVAFVILRRKRRVAAVAFILVPIIIALGGNRDRGASSLVMLDVGQGDAFLLQDRGTSILIDGGGRSDDATFGERVLLPQLLARGITRLHAVALTHPHPDHCGGLPAVLRELDVAELWLSGRQWKEGCTAQLFEIASRRGTVTRVVEHHPEFRRGELLIEVLTPRLRFKRASVNNSSIVYRATVGATRILMTGDIERDAERVLADDGAPIAADVLKVAHHGSRSSTTAAFLAAVNPKIALISCGRENLYRHPSDEVVERLRENRIAIYRSDRDGAVTLKLREHRLHVERGLTPP